MKTFIRKYKSELSTIFGCIVAVAMAWQGIDWDNFEFNTITKFKLFLSATVAIGGYMTSINIKNNNTE